MKAKMRFTTISALLVVTAIAVMGQTQLQPYRLTDREVESILRGVENQADTFRKDLRTALNKSRFNGSRREDDINAFVKEFDRDANTLRDHFNGHKSTSSDVESVLNRAAEIDRFMSRNALTPEVHNSWNTLRSDLEQLAQVYNVTWRWDAPVAVGIPVAGVPFRIDDKEAGRILNNLEHASDRFHSSLDASLDRSRLDGTAREDNVNAFVKDFYKETKMLRDHFNDHKSTSADVQSVLERAARIDQFMQRRQLSPRAQEDWAAVRASLDDLARAYGVTWGWTNALAAPASDEPVLAVIADSGSTNSPAYKISLGRGGHADIATSKGLGTGYVPAALAERFFADLAAAMPLAQLPLGQPCYKSSSFRGSVHIDFGTQRSPDLGCATGARVEVLRQDINDIRLALNVR